MKRLIYFILVCLWMITIFWFSSQNGDDSQATSDVFTNRIVKFLNFSNEDVAKSAREILSFVVRKFAHFMIYFIGGFLIYGFINSFELSVKNVFYYSILIGFLYAALDELHQHFVPGRSAQIRDIFIDTFGVFLMVGIRWLIDTLYRGKQKC